MESVELAWAAGLFEGEGSCFARKKDSGHHYIELSLASTDEDVLRRFHDAVGVGTVHGPRKLPGRKPIWTWRCGVTEVSHQSRVR